MLGSSIIDRGLSEIRDAVYLSVRKGFIVIDQVKGNLRKMPSGGNTLKGIRKEKVN